MFIAIRHCCDTFNIYNTTFINLHLCSVTLRSDKPFLFSLGFLVFFLVTDDHCVIEPQNLQRLCRDTGDFTQSPDKSLLFTDLHSHKDDKKWGLHRMHTCAEGDANQFGIYNTPDLGVRWSRLCWNYIKHHFFFCFTVLQLWAPVGWHYETLQRSENNLDMLVFFSGCFEVSQMLFSPVTRLNCWQSMFWQTTDALTFVCVIGCVPHWHFYKMRHIIFTWHVCDLAVLFRRWREWWRSYKWEGSQASNHSSKLSFNISECETTVYCW